MPQVVNLSSRGISVNFPDDATPEEIQEALDEYYPRNGADVAHDIATERNFHLKGMTLDDYEMLRGHEGKIAEGKGALEKTMEAAGMLAEDIGSGLKAAYRAAKKGQYGPTLSGSLNLGRDIAVGGLTGTYDLGEVIHGIFEVEDAEDTYNRHLSENDLKDTPEARKDYRSRLANDFKDFKKKMDRADFRQGIIDLAVVPEVAHAASYGLDASVPATFGLGALAKAPAMAATKTAGRTVGQVVGGGFRQAGRAATVVGEVPERVAGKLLGEGAEAATRGVTTLGGGLGVATGTVIPAAPAAAKAAGAILDVAGDVLESASRAAAEGGRKGTFARSAELAETTAGKNISELLARVETPLSYAGEAIKGAGAGMAIGGTLGGLAEGEEGFWHGIGIGGPLGIGGSLVGRAVGDAFGVRRAALSYEDAKKYLSSHRDAHYAIKALDKLSPADAAHLADSVMHMEKLGVKVTFHDDNVPPPALSPEKVARKSYSGVMVDESGVFINTDRVTESTGLHEAFHATAYAMERGKFLGEVQGMLLGKTDPVEGLIVRPGALSMENFAKFVESYAGMMESSAARLRVAGDEIGAAKLEVQSMEFRRKVAEGDLQHAVDEFGAFYWDAFVRGEEPKLFIGGEKDLVVNALNWAKKKASKAFMRDAQKAGLDFSQGTQAAFIRGKQRQFAIPEFDAAIRRLVKNGDMEVTHSVPVTGIPKAQAFALAKLHGAEHLFEVSDKGEPVRVKTIKEIETESKADVEAALDAIEVLPDNVRRSEIVVDEKGRRKLVARNLSNEEKAVLLRTVRHMNNSQRQQLEAFVAGMDSPDGKPVYKVSYWKASGAGRGKRKPYGQFEVSERDALPYSLEMNATGGLYLRFVDMDSVNSNLLKARRLKVYKNLHSSHREAVAEFHSYLENLDSDSPIPSAEFFGGGEVGRLKRNLFYEALGTVPRKDDPPLHNMGREGYTPKRGRNFAFKNFRVERLGNVEDTGVRVKFGESAYERSIVNMLPDESPARFMPDVEGGGRMDAPELKGPAKKRVGTTGQYVGAPRGMSTPQSLGALRKRIDMLTVEGQPGRFWYENSSDAILEATGGNLKEAEIVAALVAVYSPANRVYPNFSQAIKAYQQHISGKPIKAGRFGRIDREAARVLNGERWQGVKTNNFYVNLMRNVDPSLKQGVTVDMWIMRLFGYDTDSPSTQQYAFAEKEIKRIAKKLGWEAQQVQAAMWVSGKARWESVWGDVKKSAIKKKDLFQNEETDKWEWKSKAVEKKYRKKARVKMFAIKNQDVSKSKFDFSDAARRDLGQLSLESRPGDSAGIIPGIARASYIEQIEYHAAMERALTDHTGRDVLSTELGLMEIMAVNAPGVWLDQVNPSKQTSFIAPKQGKEVHPALRETLNEWAAFQGLLRRQEAVGWHRPFYTDFAEAKVGEANGMQLDFGRTLTPEETRALSEAMLQLTGGDTFAAIAHKDGIRFLNFAEDNVAFHRQVRAATDTVFAMRPEVEATGRRFFADSDLISNNWKENPHGDIYRQRLLRSRRSDLYRRHYRLLAPKIDQVNASFSEKYGWGEPGRHLSDLDPASTAPSKPVDTSTRFMPDVGGQDALGMFSAAERATVDLKQEKGGASQMLAMIKKAGVKDEELKALGLDKFLEGNRKVTKDEIIDHLVENQITVEETVLGEVLPPLERLPSEYETGSRERVIRKHEYAKELKAKYDQVLDRLTKAHDKLSPNEQKQVEVWDKSFNDWVDYWGQPRIQNEPSGSHTDVMKWANEVLPGAFNESLFRPDVVKEWIVFEGGDRRKVKGRGRSKNEAESDALQNINDLRSRPDAATKHDSYVEPGAVEGSYRELLLRLPEKAAKARVIQAEDGLFYIQHSPHERSEVAHASRQSAESVLAKSPPSMEPPSETYKGGHYGDTPNTLAHVRFNDRTSEHGKTLFIEEIQSDWHQEGRKKGYKTDVDPAILKKINDLKKAEDKLDSEIQAKSVADDVPQHIIDAGESADGLNSLVEFIAESNRNDPRYQKREAIMAERMSLESQVAQRDTVPDAPFKTSWHELSMKRMISYAAKHGYDAISWTKGETQFQRYGSSEIAWVKDGDGWKVKATEQRGGEADGINIETAARAEGILKEGGDTITSKEQLHALIKETVMDRERGQWSPENFEKQVDKLTSRTWERMQNEDAGTSLPRKEGMGGFYDRMLPKMKTWKKLGLKVETDDLGKLTPEQREFAEIDKLGKYDNADHPLTDRYWELHDLLGREEALQAVDPKSLPAHLVKLTPEVKAKVLDTGIARFMPDAAVPGAERNSIGWSMLMSKAGNWRVYSPDGVLAGVAGSKQRAEQIFKTKYKRELRKKERSSSVRYMPDATEYRVTLPDGGTKTISSKRTVTHVGLMKRGGEWGVHSMHSRRELAERSIDSETKRINDHYRLEEKHGRSTAGNRVDETRVVEVEKVK